ncbi:MAG: hypothetical protein KKB51_03055 [Candidatus Riflebacteria bacterium]|nr:hypothetical protein [Candidatus Riflebacteria bacterium]
MKKSFDRTFLHQLMGLSSKMLLILLVFASATSSAQVSATAVELQQQNLETAFMRAFSDPAEFRNTEVFQLLGYSSDEISEIGKITPRPASITVHAEPNGQIDGFKNIRVVCTKVLYYNLTIDRVTFEFPDCRLCLAELSQGRLRFLDSGQIKLRTEVSSADITRVFNLVARARKLSRLKIKLDKDRATIRGRVQRGLLVVEFNLTGDAELVNPGIVDFRFDRLVMNGIAMPRNAVSGISKQINPVFDANKTWLNLNIASINIRRGFVETIATIERRKG